MSDHHEGTSIKYLNMMKISSKDQYNRWYDSVSNAANILGIRDFLDDPEIIENKISESKIIPYYALKNAMMTLLSENLYHNVHSNNKLEILQHQKCQLINAHLKPT